MSPTKPPGAEPIVRGGPGSGPGRHRSRFAEHWQLDPSIAFLNHGSFGACPRAVLAAQQAWRQRIEEEPVRFLDRELEALLDDARTALGAFIGARPDDLAFVPNATSGVNTVLASLRLEPGDELLATDHEYNACLNAARAMARRCGATVVVAAIPFPIRAATDAVAAVLGRVTSRTRLALVSHVTSPTGLVLPIAEIVRELEGRGIDTLVDGAHAPGMVPLDLDGLGAAYYTGNGHKWLCGPKGSGFLHVRADRRDAIHPLVISHGANSDRTDRSSFHLEFDWPGTPDPTPYLALPDAIRFLGLLLPGGWPELMAANRRLALRARDLLCDALRVDPPAPDELIGSLAAVPLPNPRTEIPPGSRADDPLARTLFDRHGIEVPVMRWPVPAAVDESGRPTSRILRVSAQLYNDESEYAELAGILPGLLESEARRVGPDGGSVP